MLWIGTQEAIIVESPGEIMFKCYVAVGEIGSKRTILVSSRDYEDEARRDARSATSTFHRARYACVRTENGATVLYLPIPDNYYDADPKTVKLRTLEPYQACDTSLIGDA